jgi:hypothetical protein
MELEAPRVGAHGQTRGQSKTLELSIDGGKSYRPMEEDGSAGMGEHVRVPPGVTHMRWVPAVKTHAVHNAKAFGRRGSERECTRLLHSLPHAYTPDRPRCTLPVHRATARPLIRDQLG